jgi:hypothetical protein
VTRTSLVPLADLRQGLAILLDELERRHGAVADLDADYYWTVNPQDAFRLDAAGAPEPTVGQLTDDIEALREMLKANQDRPVVVWHDLAHLIGILGRLAALDAPPGTSEHNG